MILTGWLLEKGIRSTDAGLKNAARGVLFVTIVGSMIAPISLPISGRLMRGSMIPLDFVFAVGTCIAMLPALWLLVAKSDPFRAAAFLAGAWALVLPATIEHWGRTVTPVDEREIAAVIKSRCGDGPYVFDGGDTSLPLCFSMREEIPRIDDRRGDLLLEAAARTPSLAVIYEIPEHRPPPVLPPAQFVLVVPDVGALGQHFRVYALGR